jgi:5-hydroxyisourate hydrolase
MPRLSTHVLDTTLGKPVGGIPIELHRLEPDARIPVASSVTNADGRTDTPLLSADRLDVGIYELTFRVGAYLRRVLPGLADPPFFDDVVVRIGVADPGGNYHVPLLLSAHGYTVYRGS